MADDKSTVAVFPGTFDPITNGHMDVIVRAAKLFSRVIVTVGDNPEKDSLLEHPTRVEIVGKVISQLPNVSVETYTGLTVDIAEKLGANVIIRGIRNTIDVGFELQMAITNRSTTEIETVFIVPSRQCAFISSSLVRQIARGGRDISDMVPPQVLDYLKSP